MVIIFSGDNTQCLKDIHLMSWTVQVGQYEKHGLS